MSVQYKIYEVDKTQGLSYKKYSSGGNQEISFLLEPNEHLLQQPFDSFEEAVDCLKNNGSYYTEYTIIPRIYLIS
jgi:hypothetical protein